MTDPSSYIQQTGSSNSDWGRHLGKLVRRFRVLFYLLVTGAMTRETQPRLTIITGIETRRRREARVRTAIPEERRPRVLILRRSWRTESVAITNIARSATRAFCRGGLTGKHFVILDSLLAIADGILSIDKREDDHEDCEQQRLGSSSRCHDDGIAICTSVYQTQAMDLEKGGPVCPQQRPR